MNLSTVKSITIPAGNVTAFSIGGVKVWGGGSSGDEPAELLSWEGVAYHINKGTYKDVYAIGDMVPLDLGSEGLINMQIAAFDADILADGSGTAAISWVAKELLKTTRPMNSSGSSVGGWESCEMRAYLQGTIKAKISDSIYQKIEAVQKTQNANVNGTVTEQTTIDDLWLTQTSQEAGPSGKYNGLFTDYGSSRKKCIVGTTTAVVWWTRSGSTSTSVFLDITATGANGSKSSSELCGVCLCFCTGKTPA